MNDCSDITFIMASRNDGYACSVLNNWQEEQYKKINCCIHSASETFPNSKFILIEPDPPEQNKKFKDLFFYENLKIITINKKLHEDLKLKSNGLDLKFYEFVYKHIGALLCETEYLVFINQDLIFPKARSDVFLNSLRSGEINICNRLKIDYNLINLETKKLYNLVNSMFKPKINSVDIFANGDFLALKKDKYLSCGGYLLAYQNWAVDNEILDRLGLENLQTMSMRKGVVNKISRNYDVYLLDHPVDYNGALRPRNDFFIPIDSEIVNNLLKYVEKE